MQNYKLKAELFLQLADELQADGATELNTEVVEAPAVPSFPGSFAKLMRKIGGKFVTLVGKWGGLGFILYVTLVQSVPERTPIYAPSAFGVGPRQATTLKRLTEVDIVTEAS